MSSSPSPASVLPARTTKFYLDSLVSTLTDETPFISGVYQLPKNMLSLLYGKETTGGLVSRPTSNLCSLLHSYICIRRIDFTNVSEEALRHLSDMCDPATFGLNNEDVLDESYRKARKLDNSYFHTTFDVVRSGLLETIHSEFLVERHIDKRIRAEMYKLNIYGTCHVIGILSRCISMSLIRTF